MPTLCLSSFIIVIAIILLFIFDKYKIDTVIHFAGLKSINESIDDPLNYYDNNIGSTLNLLKTMQEFNCYKLI